MEYATKLIATIRAGSWSRRKGSAGLAVMAIVALVAPTLAATPVVPTVTVAAGQGNTKAYLSSNGTTVVNINTPNAAGLSHNYYTQYNVGSNGLVLNNDASSQLTVQSQLAGQLFANLNLINPASVILNEVVSNNRSTLAGFTEVAGTKADVIVANPYGITCTGCGFINTDHATLTTGTPVVGSNGALTGFNVQQGDILVNGDGLNGSNQLALDLVTRSVELQAPINTQDLGIVAGLNTWNYASRSVTGSTSGTGAAPAYAIDSALVGGMYANRINLIATEAGVGVRLLGNAAANAGDFTLTAAGTIVLQAPVSAGGNIAVSTTSTDPQALQLTDNTYAASQNITLQSNDGGMVLNGGVLVAGQNLSLAAASLSDTAGSSTLKNENLRSGASGTSFDITGAATLDGTTWQANSGSWLGSFGSLSIGAGGTQLLSGGTLGATTTNGDLALGSALIQSAGNLDLSASGAVNTTGAKGEAVESTAGALTISAGGGLDNAGTLSADTGAATLHIGGTLTNTGNILAATALTVTDQSGAGKETVDNSGSMLSNGTLNLQGDSVTNEAGATVKAQTGSTVQATSLNNSGTWLSSTQAATDSFTVGGTLTNNSILESGGALTITAGGISNSSSLEAIGNLQLNLGGATPSFVNTGTMLAGAVYPNGTVQAGATLGIAAPNLNLSNPAGAKLLGDELNFTLAGLSNGGTIQGGGSSSSIVVTNTLDNTGTLTLATAANGGGTISAATLSNEGTLQSIGGMSLDIGTAFTDSGSVLVDGSASVSGINTGTYTADISGNLQSASLAMSSASGITVEDGGIIQGGQITLGSPSAYIGALAVNSNSGTTGGQISAQGNLDIYTNSLSMGGSGDHANIVGAMGGAVNGATPDVELYVSSPFTVNGVIFSTTNLDLYTAGLTTTSSGNVSALGNLSLYGITSGNNYELNNSGLLYAGAALGISGADNVNNTGTSAGDGILSGNGTVSISGNTITNSGTIQAPGDITLNAGTINNEVPGGDAVTTTTVTTITNDINGTGSVSPPNDCVTSGSAGCGYSFPNEYWIANFTETQDITQQYTNGQPGFRPQIISTGGSGTVTLEGFSQANNIGGLISGSNIVLSGTGTFTNNDMALENEDTYQTWQWYVQYTLLDALPNTNVNNSDYNQSAITVTSSSSSNFGAGIFAKSLTGTGGFSFVNDGLPSLTLPGFTLSLPANGSSPPVPAATSAASWWNTALTPVAAITGTLGKPTSGSNALSSGKFDQISGITIPVPGNPNGYFIIDLSPTAEYLIETNPLLSDGSNYVGASYLENELGINPDASEKLVGDNNYQAYLVEQELIAQTGNDLLNNYASLAQEMSGMETAAADEGKSLDLSFGQPLTANQQADLTQDMVWMVSTVVDGQTVLAPVVYLTATTKAGIASGAVVQANSVDLDVSSLSNTGGTIEASNNLNVVATDSIVNNTGTLSAGGTMTMVAQNNIVNDSGTISANNMALVSTSGSVVDETSVSRQGNSSNYQDVAGPTGTITANNNLVISGDQGVDIVGATVNAGNAATIYSANGNINVQSQALSSQSTTQTLNNSAFSSSSSTSVTNSQTEQAASINVGKGGSSNAQLTLAAGTGDVNLTSANLNSSGGINIVANNVNSTALNLTNSTSTTTSSSGISASGGALSIGSSSSSSQQQTTTASGSTIQAGGALNVDAQNNIVLQGGSYGGQTVSLAAGNNVITEAAGNSYSYASSSSSSGLTVGNGSLSAGASAANASGSGTNYGNAQITGANGVSVTAVNKVDIGGADMAVLNPATPPSSSSSSSAAAGPGSSSGPSPLGAVAAPPVVTASFDVAQLQAAVANGTAGSLITNAATSGMGTAAQMAAMPQAAQGALSISGGQIVSTKYENTAQQTASSSSTSVGIGTNAQSSATGASAGISLSVQSSSQTASSSAQSDNINTLSADNVTLQGNSGISLKGVAITGNSGVNLLSNGDIDITAASAHSQDSSSSQSVGVSLGLSANANFSGQPPAGSPLPLPAAPASLSATLNIGAKSSTASDSADTHVNSTLTSNGDINIQSGKGNVNWTGVTATADTLNVSGNNFTSAAYQDSSSHSSSNTSLGVNLTASTSPTQSLSSLFNGNGVSSASDVGQQTTQVGNSLAANTANIDVTNNVTLVGGDLSAGSFNIQANTVDIKAAQSTASDHSTSASASLGMTGSASFAGNTATGSIDSLKGASSNVSASNNGSNAGSSYANNSTGAGSPGVNGQAGLTIATSDTTTNSVGYSNANLAFDNLNINTVAAAGSGKGDGHVDIGGGNLQGNTGNSSINIATGELDSTKYVSSTETTSHTNTTFAGVSVEGDSAIADTASNSTALANSANNGMTADAGLTAGQSIADASNLAMGNVIGGSAAATITNTDTQSHSLSTSQNTTYVDAGKINITTTQGSINLNGVQFTAPPTSGSTTTSAASSAQPQSIALNSAQDVNITAAESTSSETSTTLQNAVNVTAGAAVSGAGSGASVQAGYNGSIEQDSLATTTYANSNLGANNVSITAQNLNMTGANVTGNNVNVNVAHDINISSVQNTQQQSTTKGNWGGSAGLDTTTVVAVNAQGGGGSSHDNFAQTGTQSGINAQNTLNVAAGGNLTLTGAQLASAGGGSVNVKGNVTANQLNDYQDQNGLFVGVSGGVGNEGKFASGGVTVQQVDQVHTASTQNSTISGVGLTVGGSLQGNNLQANGSLQTQTQTVTENEHIAGANIDATVGYTPPKSAKPDSVVVVVTRDSEGNIDPAVREAANNLAGAHPNAVVVVANKDGTGIEGGSGQLNGIKGNTHIAVVGHGDDLKQQGAGPVAGLVKHVSDQISANPNTSHVKQVEIVACGTCTRSGEQTFGQQLSASLGSEGVKVVEHDSPIQVQKDGTRVAAAGSGAKTLTSTYSKSKGVKTTPTTKGSKELVAQLDPTQTLTKRPRLGSDASEGDEGDVQQGNAVHEEEVAPPPVAAVDGNVVVQHAPAVQELAPPPAAKAGGDVVMQNHTVVDQAKAVSASMAAAASRHDDDHMSVEDDGQDDEEDSSAAKPATPCHAGNCLVSTKDSKGIPVSFRKSVLKQGVVSGDAEGGHQYSTMTMTKAQYEQYKKDTGVGSEEKEFPVGNGLTAKVALSRRGSFSGLVDDGSGKLAVFRLSSHLSTNAMKAANDEPITPEGLRDAATLGATDEAKRPNVVTGTAVTLAYDPVRKTVNVKDGLYAQGISGAGVKSISAPGASTVKNAKEYAYAPNHNSADQAAESGVGRPEAVYHSEPMTITKMNDAAHENAVPDLAQAPHLVLFTSVPRQACDNCGHALAENNNKDSLVSVESAEPFAHFKPGEVSFGKDYTLPDARAGPPEAGKNVARVTKAVPHAVALEKGGDAQRELSQVNAVRDFHRQAATASASAGGKTGPDSTAPDSLVVVMTHDGSGNVDPAVRQAADNLARAHPNKNVVIVTASKDGTGIKGDAGQLDAITGNTHIAVVGHGATLRQQGAGKVADLVKNVAGQVDGNPNKTAVKQVEIVACGTCTKVGDKTFGQQVAEGVKREDMPVVEHDSPIQVQDDGSRVAAAGRGAKTLTSTYSAAQGRAGIRFSDKTGDELVPSLDGSRALTLQGKEVPADALKSTLVDATKIPGFDPSRGAPTIVGDTDTSGKRGASVYDTTGKSSDTTLADVPNYPALAKKAVATGTDLGRELARMPQKDLDAVVKRLNDLSAVMEGAGEGKATASSTKSTGKRGSKRLAEGMLSSTHATEASKKAKQFDEDDQAAFARAHRGTVKDADEIVSTSTTFNLLAGIRKGAAEETATVTAAKKGDTTSDIEPAREAMQRFLSAIRQPTRNVQSVSWKADGTFGGGVIHPTKVKEHPLGLKGNSSEHIYADQARADTFLKTVESLVDSGVPPDQALILGTYKAMQYTLDVMEAPFMAEGASQHPDARRMDQTTQRDAVKTQLDGISDLFGLPTSSATQAADAPRTANAGSHSPFRTDAPTDMRWPGAAVAVAAPAPAAKSGP